MREQLQQALDREKTVRSTFLKNQEELQAKVEAANLAKSSMETHVTALSSKVKFWSCENGFLDPRWQPEGPYKIRSSVLPPFRLSGCFLGIVSLVFSRFGMVLETQMKLYVTELDFLEKIFLTPKLRKWTKNGPETGFYEFIEKFSL